MALEEAVTGEAVTREAVTGEADATAAGPRRSGAVALMGAGLVTAAVGFSVGLPSDHDSGVVPVAAGPVGLPSRVHAPMRPERLRIPSLRVDAPVVPVGVRGGELAVPHLPSVVGWWEAGARAGDPTGTTVLDGHVDAAGYGPGALFRLRELRPGDVVRVAGAGAEVDYVVRAVRFYRKDELPPDTFDTAGPPRLVLVSCGGPFDRATGTYRDNVVVYAT